MNKTVLHEGDEGVTLIIREQKSRNPKNTTRVAAPTRSPVHVVYGGADRFRSGIARKLGGIALNSLETYAPGPAEFARAFGLSESTAKGTVALIRERTIQKLRTEPIEDFRIDFEDGYGFRPDAEEDADAERCAAELAAAFGGGSITAFSGFRIKSYANETRDRARRTLNIFLDELLELTKGKLPKGFVVTLPKVTDKKEVAVMCRDLKKIEKMARIREGTVKIELMVEQPLALIDRKGNFALRHIVEAARGRCVAAHFGAYDHTASLGIAASHQDLNHPACDFARQMMLTALSPLGIRLSDSVTTQIPLPVHKGEKLTQKQKAENKAAVAAGWRTHFDNVRRSMANGFYQSWDLHPNQLVARYAAVYSFFLEAKDAQGARLRAFIAKATQATLSGSTFDDAASAMGIVNFFRQGLDCGAITETEAEQDTGLSAAQLRASSFKEMVDNGYAR